jgi:D-sedoheptulose 7-phosphate isomerase/D-glycero-D-manno-heptose 1,7-bisphosphate phosphatase
MKFPNELSDSAADFMRQYAEASNAARQSVDAGQFEAACDMLADAYMRGATVFVCGNGGSTAIANHMVCDHGKLIATGTDLKPRVMSLSHANEMITAIANDIGYEAVFAYQLGLMANRGDVLVAISGSGSSPNIVRALKEAKKLGLHTIAMTAFTGGPSREIADVSLHVAVENYGIAEDIHQSLMQMIAQYIRIQNMDPKAIASTKF